MTYVAQCLTDGAVGLWELGEAVFASAAADQAGVQAGTYVNSSGVVLGQTGIPGVAGVTAAKLVAANQGYISVPSVTGNHLANVFTVEAWAKRSSLGTDQVIFGGPLNAPEVSFDTSNQVSVTKTYVATLMDSTAIVTDTTIFHHIVWTHNAGVDQIWLDGVNVSGPVLATGTFTNSAYTIGTNFGAGSVTQPYDGTLAMVAIYPTILTQAQIDNHYILGSLGVVNLTPPVASVPNLGSTVTVTNGTWAGSPTTFTYQWRRNGGNIAGQTGRTYSYQAGDLGNTIDCSVTASSPTSAPRAAISTGVAQTASGQSWERSVQPGFGSLSPYQSELEPSLLIDAAGANYLLYTTQNLITFAHTWMNRRTCPIGSDPTVPANWSAPVKVLGNGGSGYSGNAQENAVFLIGGTYYNYFSTGVVTSDLMVSTSADGITWGTPTVAIAHNAVTWAADWANTAVFKDGSGTWHMLVEAYPTGAVDQQWVIAYATSTDGLTYTIQGSGPLTSLQAGYYGYSGPNFARNGALIDGLYVIWYHVNTAGGSSVTTSAVWAATSPDLINWTPLGVQIFPTGEPTELQQVADPSILEHNGNLYLFTSGDTNITPIFYINFQQFAGSIETFLGFAVPYVFSDTVGPIIALIDFGAFDVSKPKLASYGSGAGFGFKASHWYGGGLYGSGIYGTGTGAISIPGSFDSTDATLAAFDRPEPSFL